MIPKRTRLRHYQNALKIIDRELKKPIKEYHDRISNRY